MGKNSKIYFFFMIVTYQIMKSLSKQINDFAKLFIMLYVNVAFLFYSLLLILLPFRKNCKISPEHYITFS